MGDEAKLGAEQGIEYASHWKFQTWWKNLKTITGQLSFLNHEAASDFWIIESYVWEQRNKIQQSDFKIET